ncbi:ArsR/SmtB family transcription factor [Sinosporangium siamense]|uniref:Transcriptional regulator n=1 Tax=Sinosporangium siamense TaxID=1367973 RepID=A0A919R9Y5_9ACTN|nr:DUF5937 family protein [Sinosporangium siamense]GII90111.1 transcriptional regulator [Sinosporangium siamense]
MAVEWIFGTEDVARIRFAFSPLWEVVFSLRALRDPARHSVHLPFVRAVRPRIAALGLSDVFDLIPAEGYVPDFITPPPASPVPDFEADLDLIRRAPPGLAAEEVAEAEQIGPAVTERFRADPEGCIDRVVAGLRRYWDEVFADYWPRVYGLLESDVLWRSRRLASGGARELFADLNPAVRWDGDRLWVLRHWRHSRALSGEGLLLVPTAFRWPDVATIVYPYQPMLAYPARGIGTLWVDQPPPAPEALAALLGRTRAMVLTALAEPASTTSLARRFSLTPGAVSQHLAVLVDGGLVARRRVGRVVVYRRTPMGDALVCAS